MKNGIFRSIARSVLCAGLLAAAVWARSNGLMPIATAGVPGESDCAQCHTTFALNSGQGSLKIQPDSLTYTPGQSMKIRVILSDPSAQRWGFNLTARLASNTANPGGVIAVTDAANTQVRSGANGVQHVTHTTAGSRQGALLSTSWEVTWTAPGDASAGTVTFYAAGNAANGDGTNGGDRIYSSSVQVTAGAAGPVTTKVLPQFVFGAQAGAGAWYSAIYLHNTNAGGASVPIDFYASDGTPMTVPGLGGSSTTVSLAGKSSAMVEAPNLGPLTQGWAKLEVPEGVIGYGVFRQSVQGNNDQEGTAAFSGIWSALNTIVFDDNGFDTAVALLNPNNYDVPVTITARDDQGNTLGAAAITVKAGGREAFVLKSRPEFTTIQGKRGSVDFAASVGSIAVLGLRFKGPSFTSILAAER
ncbi:MAG: hypothetical protein HY858_13410 [Candidatus Solibacter usitatus]|nr:hypothetical protein [Candidatus Solibacter usitatus]